MDEGRGAATAAAYRDLILTDVYKFIYIIYSYNPMKLIIGHVVAGLFCTDIGAGTK